MSKAERVRWVFGGFLWLWIALKVPNIIIDVLASVVSGIAWTMATVSDEEELMEGELE